jgi:hypothetical protein
MGHCDLVVRKQTVLGRELLSWGELSLGMDFLRLNLCHDVFKIGQHVLGGQLGKTYLWGRIVFVRTNCPLGWIFGGQIVLGNKLLLRSSNSRG